MARPHFPRAARASRDRLDGFRARGSDRGFRARAGARRLAAPDRDDRDAADLARGVVDGPAAFGPIRTGALRPRRCRAARRERSEEHTSELQSLMRTSYAV